MMLLAISFFIMNLQISIAGEKALMYKLNKLSKNIKNLKPAFREMKPSIISEFKDNFPAKGRKLNAPWAKRKHLYPWSILDKTGKLKKNWKGTSKRKQLEIVNPTKYARYHHFGTHVLPVRKLVGISTKIKNVIIKSITSFLLKSFKKY